MARYGNLQLKRDIEYTLDSGSKYLQQVIKDFDNEEKSMVYEDFNNLKKVLYNEGRKLSYAKAAMFEKRMNKIEKALDKLYENITDSVDENSISCSKCGITYNEEYVNTTDYEEDVCVKCEKQLQSVEKRLIN